jgi:hypothetical protein
MADDRREQTQEETEEREEEERDRDQPKEGEPWAKVNSGDTESMTSD